MKMKNRSLLVFPLLIAALLLSACGIVNELTTVTATGNDFMTALRDRDFDTSYDMLTTGVKNEIGDKGAWVTFARPRNFDSWTFSNTEFENDMAQIDGEAMLGTDKYDIRLVFQKVGEAWMIAGMNIEFVE